jgi:hypothetical protein
LPAPLYNDNFRELLDVYAAEDYATDIQIMARLIDPRWTRWDEFSEDIRPSLLFIEETAAQFGVQPCEIFTCIANDILSGETGSGHDLLVELLEWIVLATPLQRTNVLGGFAVHQRMLLEDRQTLRDQAEQPCEIDGEMKSLLDDLRGLDADPITVGK